MGDAVVLACSARSPKLKFLFLYWCSTHGESIDIKMLRSNRFYLQLLIQYKGEFKEMTFQKQTVILKNPDINGYYNTI